MILACGYDTLDVIAEMANLPKDMMLIEYWIILIKLFLKIKGVNYLLYFAS